MNLRTALIGALALNLILAACLATLLLGRLHPAPPVERVQPPPNPAASTPPPPAPAPPSAATPAALFDWRMVESEDYKKYIANLRTIGCPEETIRDIITADVNKLFESRRKELRKDKPKFQFWKAGAPLAGLVDPELLQKDMELNKEKRALLTELLGSAPAETPVSALARMNPFETMLDFLPTDKQTQVMEVMERQQGKMMKIVGGGGMMDAEDMKKMRDLQRESDQELARILTPQELEDYQLRMSQTAMTMRMGLGAFNPTEQEFREIFNLRKPFDDEHTQFVDGTDQTAMQRRMEAEEKVKESIRKLLGDQRYAEYERSQDYNFQQISKLAERQGLPAEAAVKAYDMSRTAQTEFFKVQQDHNMTPEQRQTALQGIRAETERSLRQVMGDQGYESYRKQPMSYWLRSEPIAPTSPVQGVQIISP